MRIPTDSRRNANPGVLVRDGDYWQQQAPSVPHRDARIWNYGGDAIPREMARRLERLGLPQYAPVPRAPTVARPTIVRWAARNVEVWNNLPAGDCSDDVIILEHHVWLEGKTSEGCKVAYVVAWRSDAITAQFFRNWAVAIGTMAEEIPNRELTPAELRDEQEEAWLEWREAENGRALEQRRRKSAARARRKAAGGRRGWGTATVKTSGFTPC